MYKRLEKNVDHALVRFIDSDSLQVIPIEKIDQLKPTNRSDFEQWVVYKTIDESSIQVLRLGSKKHFFLLS